MRTKLILIVVLSFYCLIVKANPDSLRQEAIMLLYAKQYEEARQIYQQIIPQFYEQKDYYQYIKSYSGVLFSYRFNQEYDTTIQLANKVLPEAINLLSKNDSTVADFYYYLAESYFHKQDYSKAHFYYKKQYDIQKQYAEINYIYTLSKLADTAYKLGDCTTMVELLKKLIPIRKEQFLLKKEQYSLAWYVYEKIQLAKAYKCLGDYQKSRAVYFEVLSKVDLIDVKDYRLNNKSIIYNNIGHSYVQVQDYDSAEYYFNKAIAFNDTNDLSLKIPIASLAYLFLKKKGFDKALVLIKRYQKYLNHSSNLAELGKFHDTFSAIYIGLQNYDSALYHLQHSLINFIPTFNDSSIYTNPSLEVTNSEDALLFAIIRKGIAFTGKAKQTKEERDYDMAIATFWKGMQLIDKMRQKFEAQGSKRLLATRSWWTFEAAIKGCLELYEDTGEANYQEYAFQFAEKSKAVLIRDAISESLAKQKTTLPDSLQQHEHELKMEISLLENQLFQAEKKKEVEKSQEVRNQLLNTRDELRLFTSKIEREYPDYRKFKYDDKRVNLNQVQQQLSDDQVVIEYFVGDEHIYVFSITRKKLAIETVPYSKELEDYVAHIRDGLNPKKQSQDASSYQLFSNNAYQLQQLILANSLKQLPSAIKQLTIIPDGMLSYVPFEVLLTSPADQSIADYRTPDYLIKQFQINYAYSATLLAQEALGIANNPSENGVLAFAPSYPASITDSMEIQQLGRFRDQVSPLIWNTKEVQKIAEYLPTTYFLNQDASETKFKDLASQYRIIHLAMHALIDDDNPMTSRLVFSKANSAENDRYLNVYELYNMKLNADLAILSACNTGYGKYIRGEGLVSLGQAFSYAGCPSVVISHWSVDDQATSALMQEFYKGLSEGLTKSAAMRNAKLSYLDKAGPREGNPIYWGSFVVIGDDTPIKNSFNWWWIIGGSALVILTFLVFIKRRAKS